MTYITSDKELYSIVCFFLLKCLCCLLCQYGNSGSLDRNPAENHSGASGQFCIHIQYMHKPPAFLLPKFFKFCFFCCKSTKFISNPLSFSGQAPTLSRCKELCISLVICHTHCSDTVGSSFTGSCSHEVGSTWPAVGTPLSQSSRSIHWRHWRHVCINTTRALKSFPPDKI